MKEIIEMILSCMSVLILIMSPVLSAALVAPNSLSIQEILDYFVNYILINVFILNSTEAFLKFSFITLRISNIAKLSHFFFNLSVSFCLWRFYCFCFVLKGLKSKGMIFRKWCFVHVYKQIPTSSVDVSTAALEWRGRDRHFIFKSA